MTAPRRQMHLGVFVLGTGDHSAGWRYEGALHLGLQPAGDEIDRQHRRARQIRPVLPLRRAGDGRQRPSLLRQPVRAADASGGAQHGARPHRLGCTVSTSFSEPYNVARAFASLDHISGGRAAWNVVTSTNDAAASISAGTAQRARPSLRDRRRVRRRGARAVGWLGRRRDRRRPGDRYLPRCQQGTDAQSQGPVFFQVKGPLNIERSPQGHPIIIQAGGSLPGQELSARSADLVFSVVNGDPVSAKAAYDSLKQRVIKHGRRPEHVAILPGVMPIVGETDAEAKEQLDRLQSFLIADQRAHPGIAADRL